MLTKTQKGVTNGKGTTVAKVRAKKEANGKARNAIRQSSAGIPVGAQPVRYRPITIVRPQDQQRKSATRISVKSEPAAAPPIQESYSGPKVETLTRLAAVGLVLLGFVAGCVVGKGWL